MVKGYYRLSIRVQVAQIKIMSVISNFRSTTNTLQHNLNQTETKICIFVLNPFSHFSQTAGT